MLLPIVLLLGLLFVWPTLQFLTRAFIGPDGSPGFDNFTRFFQQTAYGKVLRETMLISLWVTLITVLISYPVAYVLARADRSRKSWWVMFVLLPFWSSFLVRTFALVFLLGRNGPINEAAVAMGLVDEPMRLIFTRGSVLLGMTNVMVPFAVLTMLGVFERINAALVPAAQTLGARPARAFARIYLPLSLPGVTAAALLVFVTCIGFFITPALLGSPRDMMIAQPIIQQVIELTNWPFAATMCLILFAITILVFVAYDRLVGMSAFVGEAAGRTAGPHPVILRACDLLGDVCDMAGRIVPRRGRRHGAISRRTAGFAMLVLLFLNVPVLFLIPLSTTEASFVTWPPDGFSLRWYEAFFTQQQWWQATARSFVVAFATAACCLLFALPAALAFMRLKGRSAAWILALVVSPMILPRIVIAVGLFYLYASVGMIGSTVGLVLGHTVIAVPFFFISTLAVLKTYDRRLDQAAASLGATPLRTFARVTVPLIMTGLVSASIFAFVISLDELNIALFTTGGLSSTLPKMMWEQAMNGFSPLLAAVSTLFLLFLTAVVLVGLSFGRRT